MPVENHICFIAEDLKPFIDLVDQYSSVLYVTQLLIRLSSNSYKPLQVLLKV